MVRRIATLVIIGGVLIGIAFAVRTGALKEQRGPHSSVLRIINWLNKPRGRGVTDLQALSRPGLVLQPRWSPDGKSIAYLRFEFLPGVSQEAKAARFSSPQECDGYFMVWLPGEERPWRLGRTEWSGGLMNAWQFGWDRDSRYLVYLYDVTADAWAVSSSSAREMRGKPFGLPAYWLSLRERSATEGYLCETAALAPGKGTDALKPLQHWFALSPDGKEIVLEVLQGHGREQRANLALWEIKTGKLRLITDFPNQTGRRLAPYDNEFAWQGDRIYFVCEHPSPARDFVPREVWSVRADGADLRQETEGPEDEYPAPRPGTRELAFVRKGSICLRREDGTVTTLVARMGRGECTGAISWSPDGTHIAFTWCGQIWGAPTIWTARVVDPSKGRR